MSYHVAGLSGTTGEDEGNLATFAAELVGRAAAAELALVDIGGEGEGRGGEAGDERVLHGGGRLEGFVSMW